MRWLGLDPFRAPTTLKGMTSVLVGALGCPEEPFVMDALNDELARSGLGLEVSKLRSIPVLGRGSNGKLERVSLSDQVAG